MANLYSIVSVLIRNSTLNQGEKDALVMELHQAQAREEVLTPPVPQAQQPPTDWHNGTA